MKVFVAKKVKPVAADATQNGIDEPGGKGAVQYVQERPERRYEQHGSAAKPALGEFLGIPGEERDRANGGQLQQAAFDAPVRVTIPRNLVKLIHAIQVQRYSDPAAAQAASVRQVT